jgi:tetratricopeptide (TPR) repeat protein
MRKTAAAVVLCLACSPVLADLARLGVASPFEADEAIRTSAQKAVRGAVGTRAEAEAIVRQIFHSGSGLGLEYARRPTKTAIEAFRDRKGNCVSMVNLFVAMSRSVGIRSFFVEVTDFETFHRQGASVIRSTHLVGGVNLDAGLLTVDFFPNREKTYRSVRAISDETAAAHYYNAVAVEAMLDRGYERAEELFETALEVDPEFLQAWNNRAMLARRQGRYEESIRQLRQALKIEPEYAPVMENLSALYRRLGREDLAGEMSARALEAKTRNPYYLLDQALLRLKADEPDEAEALLRRARRSDGRLPEVHLVLGRVELQRLNVDKALAHFRRAQRLAEPYPDGFQRGLESKIERLLVASNNL